MIRTWAVLSLLFCGSANAASVAADQIDCVIQFVDQATAAADNTFGSFVNAKKESALSGVSATKISDGTAWAGYWMIVSSPSPVNYTYTSHASTVICVGRNAMNAGQPYLYMMGQNSSIADMNDLKLQPTFSRSVFPFGSLATYPTTAVPASFFGMHIYSATAPYTYSTNPFPTPNAGVMGFSTPCNGWPYIQSVDSATYNWTTNPCTAGVDGMMALAEGYGIQFQYSMGHTPGWAVTSHATGTGSVLTAIGGGSALATNAGTAAGSTPGTNNVLHFASVPGAVTAGMYVQNATHTGSIADETTVVSVVGGNVTISSFVQAPGVSSADVISIGPWNSNLPPDNLANIDNYLNTLLTRYNADTGTQHKAVRAIECWIEPASSGGPTTTANLVTYCNRIHDYLRANWPLIKITTPSLEPDTLTRPIAGNYYYDYFAAGGTADVDWVTWHGYSSVSSLVVYQHTRNMQPTLQSFGMGAKTLVDSEGGCLTDAVCGAISLGVPQFAAQWPIYHWQAAAQHAHWYAQAGIGWGTLTGGTGTPNTTGVAYQSVYTWLVGSTLQSPGCNNGWTPNTGATSWTCDWKNGSNVPFSTYWDTAGGPTTFTIPGGYTACTDASVTPVVIIANQIAVTALPVMCQ